MTSKTERSVSEMMPKKARKPRQPRKPRFKTSFKTPVASKKIRNSRCRKLKAKLAQEKDDDLLNQNAMMWTENSPLTHRLDFKAIILREMNRLGRQPSNELKRDAKRALASRRALRTNEDHQNFPPFSNCQTKCRKPRRRKAKSKLAEWNKLLEHVAIMKKEDNLLPHRQNFKAVILREMERLGRQPTKEFERAAKESMTYARKYAHQSVRPWTKKSPKNSKQTTSQKSKRIDSKSRTISRNVRSKPSSKLLIKKKISKNLSIKNSMSLSVLFIKSSPPCPKVQSISQEGSKVSISFTMISPTPSGHEIASEKHSKHDISPLQSKEGSATMEERLEAGTKIKSEEHRQDFKEGILGEVDRLGRQAAKEFKSATSLASSRKSSQKTIPIANFNSRRNILSQSSGTWSIRFENSPSKHSKETVSRTSKEIYQNSSQMSKNVEKEASQFNVLLGRNIISQNFPARNSASLILPTASQTKSSSKSHPGPYKPSSTVLSPIQSLLPVIDSTYYPISLKNREDFLTEEQRQAVLKAIEEAEIENHPHEQ
ncbi:uncharacterized protein Dana_GF27975 [Drosophila ananassae]|uniref:Uncharacterized protein n=1 Tax=Drosophila ananassae TaxID=7217 RepID=A0A0P9BR81_DROAN|nr:uncharacterized protein LOC26515384 [Drosophila ananassae]KPU74247.1 uncharacterized protein Dana_GF27975 [Drosophila ananassae]